MTTKTETSSLAAALAAFQLELPTLGKGNVANVRSDKGNYSYRYADLAEVSTLVLPLMAKHGLSFSAKPTIDDGRFVLAYVLRHTSGEEDAGLYPLPSNATPQQVGSAITYARRYILTAISGVAPDEDDDGQAAADTRVAHQVYERPAPVSWDPDTQELVDGFMDDIRKAKTDDDIATVGKSVAVKAGKGELPKAAYDRLAQAAATRKAELNGGPK
jgi:hypothetical protein